MDPNSCAGDKAYSSPDFKLILGFAELAQDVDTDPTRIGDWRMINQIMDERKAELKVAAGQVDRLLGIKHLFLDGVDDLEATIAQGDDKKIFGRYVDIEKLGDDVEIEDSITFSRSNTVYSKKSLK